MQANGSVRWRRSSNLPRTHCDSLRARPNNSLERSGGSVFFVTSFGAAKVRRNEIAMSKLLRFPTSVERDPAIEVWMHEHSGELGAIAQRWFEVMRDCGDDVRELLHDGHPTACVGDAAYAYVNAFKAHVNVGFFRGAEIADPKGLLEGTGKFMRHVKLGPERKVDAAALMNLIETAYTDIKERLKAE